MKLIKGIHFPDSDTHFENLVNDQGHYQKKQFDAAMRHIKPEDRGLFIDVGAHVGLWSMMAIKEGFKNFLCFEPNDILRECLRKNLEYIVTIPKWMEEPLNKIQHKLDNQEELTPEDNKLYSEFLNIVQSVEIEGIGLSDRNQHGIIELENKNNSGSGVVKNIKDGCLLYGSPDRPDEIINLVGFDSHIKTLSIPICAFGNSKTLIKIDVQGYEAKVVHGMTNFIKEYKPIIIVEQWLNGKEELEATEYCLSLGMKILEKVKKEIILGW